MVLYLQLSQNMDSHFSKESGWGMGKRQGDAEGKHAIIHESSHGCPLEVPSADPI